LWLLLLVGCFTLATVIQPRPLVWAGNRDSGGVLQRLLGDSRRLFANQFFVQADVSFHSGYYPSVFDQAKAPKDTRHMTAKEGEPEAEEHEQQMNFLGPPRDWIERFGRHFLITVHSHLENGNEREILPWLKMSSELDPQKIDTYTVAAFWLRSLGKLNEAESFLREGLRKNPGNCELLFELGRLYNENFHDPMRARNVWEAALRKWTEAAEAKKNPDLSLLDNIAVHLARLEEMQGNLPRAIQLLEVAVKASPHPEALRQQIDELKQKLAAHPKAAASQAH
jgi:tetratricopeptide (TPR) repeat protein